MAGKTPLAQDSVENVICLYLLHRRLRRLEVPALVPVSLSKSLILDQLLGALCFWLADINISAFFIYAHLPNLTNTQCTQTCSSVSNSSDMCPVLLISFFILVLFFCFLKPGFHSCLITCVAVNVSLGIFCTVRVALSYFTLISA